MGAIFGLFWRKAWDNLFHIIIFNMIWLTLTIPFLQALRITGNTLFPVIEQAAAPAPAATGAAPAIQSTATAAVESTMLAPEIQSTASVAVESTATAATGAPSVDSTSAATARPRHFRWTAAGIPAIVMFIAAWLLVCVATGFVFYGTADIVANYDFSGYKDVFRTFMKKEPVARSIILVSLFAAVFVASWANLAFYLSVARSMGILFVLLAGVMLWFIVFVSMAFMYALPVAAQGNMKVFQSIKVGAVFALTYPARSFAALLVGGLVFILGVASAIGAGFFAVAAPAMLFNAAARIRLDEMEGKRPEGEATSDDDGPAGEDGIR